MIEAAALGAVGMAGVYLVALGLTCLASLARAGRFLSSFAGSPSWHRAELAVRFLAGGALVIAAPRLPGPGLFAAAGWTLIATTVVLLALRWRWHRRFAGEAVPRALRALPLVGLAALALGAEVLIAVLGPVAR
jgi:hypothetical protein